jgi:hypothetical protein
MEQIAEITLKRKSDDPVSDLWATMRELAQAGAWRHVFNRQLEGLLGERGRRVLEAGYDAHGREIQLVVIVHPYLAQAVFQVRAESETISSYVNPVSALEDYWRLTTVPDPAGL